MLKTFIIKFLRLSATALFKHFSEIERNFWGNIEIIQSFLMTFFIVGFADDILDLPIQ
jgi:hypothetical protein